MPEQNETMVDLPDSGQTVEVSVEGVVSGSEVSDDGEHLEYSKKVKRRIDKLTKKAREAERQQEAAIAYARNMQAENHSLKSRVQSLDQGYVAEYGDRIATQSEALKKDLETAIATSDTAGQVELNKQLAQLTIEEERVRAAQMQQKATYEQEAANVQRQQLAQPSAQPSIPVRPDPRAEKWAQKNNWFGEDDAMTFAAFGIHKALVEEESFDTESSEYYDELDKRMREAFPHKFGGTVSVTPVYTDGRRPQQAVASATRSSNAGRKTVKLSPSEVAIAQKLGVPLDEYAKHKR